MSEDRLPHIAVHCGRPLVWTFVFSGNEWFCMGCGRSFPMFRVAAVPTTDALEAQKAADLIAFRELVDGYISVGSYRKDCASCRFGEHASHATPDEWAAHGAAVARIAAFRAVPA